MESALRLSELASIRVDNIDWQHNTIRIWGKGRKERNAPFGPTSGALLREWLAVYTGSNGNMWGINRSGIQVMLKRLKQTTDIPCNAHSFRRAFACLLRKMGIDSLAIKDLAGWDSLEMVQRYTRSVTFSDSLKFYKAPLG